jgi:hypothetical protein
MSEIINYYYYYLLQLSFHSVAVALTLVQTKQISINIYKLNNTKTQYKQIKTQQIPKHLHNCQNTPHITKPTHTNTHTYTHIHTHALWNQYLHTLTTTTHTHTYTQPQPLHTHPHIHTTTTTTHTHTYTHTHTHNHYTHLGITKPILTHTDKH